MKPSNTFPVEVRAEADRIMANASTGAGREFKSDGMPDPAAVHQVINGHYQDNNVRAFEATRLAEQTWNHMKAIANRAETEGSLKASDMREHSAAEKLLDQLGAIANTYVDRSGVVGPAPAAAYREGVPLASNQSVVDAMRALNVIQDGQEELSLSKYLKGAMNGDWRGADTERHAFMSLSGGADSQGGIMIPEILSGQIIDLVRNRTAVLRAGARVVPMANRKVVVPRWVSHPEPEWRAEGDPIVEDDATLDSIELSAKSLNVVTKATIELLEDTSIEDELMQAFAVAYALKLDWAALYADGTNDAPTGIKNTTGVTKTPLATNGATPTWDALVDSVGRLRDNNEEPNAQIMSDRTARVLAKAKDTSGQYLSAPDYLDGIRRYVTNQVPNNLTTGTSNVTSDVFTGDWSQLYFGVRTQLRIIPLKERFLVDSGEIGFVAHWRGDFAVARPKAFDVVTGVKE